MRVRLLNTNQPMPKQSIDLQATISGIPCGIHVDHFVHVPPSKLAPHQCDSADDYYGYTEADFTVLDRKGYPAPWLEAKLTSDDEETIKNQITEMME